LVVPMRSRGATIGTLGLFERRGSNPLTEKDVIWVQEIADRTGLAVENAQLYEDAVQRLDRLTALQSVSLAVSASPDLRLTLKVFHRAALTPDQEWMAFLDALGSVAAVAIDSATMQERLRQRRYLPEVRRAARAVPPLSATETEILRMAVEGMTNREIAVKVHLSQK